jgi:hypothetical protein
MRWLLTLGVLFAAVMCCAQDETKTTVRLAQGRIEVANLPPAVLTAVKDWPADDERWTQAVQVRLNTDGAPLLPGTTRLTGARLTFRPKYSLQPGLTYEASLNADLLGKEVAATRAEIRVPSKDRTPTTAITRIYPTAKDLPENHLRFYLTFSAPMSVGEAYDHIRLLDSDGKVISTPFLDLAEEMWDPDRQRLTLLIHPGRIKRGLRSFEEAGPVLFEGKKYTLVVDRDWPDGEGAPLKAELRKSFTVTAANTRPLDARDWKLSRPPAGSQEAFTVEFPRPLDRFLLERMLSVVDSGREPIAGTVEIDQAERRWSFTPNAAWPLSATLLVDGALEDPCGNRIGIAFDLDLNDPDLAARRNAAQKLYEFPVPLRPR